MGKRNTFTYISMNKKYDELKIQFQGKIKEQEILAPFTTYKVGGPADLFYTATTADELVSIVRAARTLDIPFFILGGGSNILVGDNGFRGLVIKNATSGIALKGVKGTVHGDNTKSLVYVEVDTGVPMNRLVRFTIEEGFAGLEMHLGLPGTVGGAVAMNSKWTRPVASVGDCVHQGIILTSDNEVRQVSVGYFHFSLGKSSISIHGDILLRVIFALQKCDTESLWKSANESIEHRRLTQPQGVRTAGCVFRNISLADAIRFQTPNKTQSAGYLLDASGCKGMKVQGAEVSTIHANFIVTGSRTTAGDVVELIDQMKKIVKKKFGVTLKEEIIRVGDFVERLS